MGREGWDAQTASSLLLDMKGHESWLLLQRQSVLLHTISGCTSIGGCRQAACISTSHCWARGRVCACVINPAPSLQGRNLLVS